MFRTASITMLLLVQQLNAQESRNLVQLYTSQSGLKIARFHALLIFSGVSNGIIDKNQSHLGDMLQQFNYDINELSHDQKQPVPENFQITAVPTVLASPQLTWSAIKDTFTKLRPRLGKDDVVFIYILAHGTERADAPPTTTKAPISSSRILRRIDLKFSDRLVPRSEIVDIARKLRARLTVLITDNCAESKNEPEPAVSHQNPVPAAPHEAKTLIWRSLYFGHHGFVDISSTKQGQLGHLDHDLSLFNDAFTHSFDLSSIDESWPNGQQIKKNAERIKKEESTRILNASHEALLKETRQLWQQALETQNPGQRKGIVEWKREYESHLRGVFTRTLHDKLPSAVQEIDFNLDDVYPGAE